MRAPARLASSRRLTPRRATSSSAPRARAASASRRTCTRSPGRDGEMLAMDVARDGPMQRDVAAVVSSGCHGVEGFCGSGVQVAMLERRGVARAAEDGRRRRPLHPRPQPATASRGGGGRRTRTSTSTATSATFRRRAPRNASYDEIAALIVPESWPPDAATTAAHRPLRRRARREGLAASHLGRPVRSTPKGLFFGGTAPTWSHETLRQVLRDHGTRCARLAWIDLHTGLGPNGHGERIFACRDDDAAYARAKAWWGDVTSFYDGSSTSAPC